MEAPARPVLRWHGGKWLLAPKIIKHLPPHRVYVEPFGGAASVLMRKPRSYAEVYNDLDSEVVNFFRVLRDPVLADALRIAIMLTPFAREEFFGSYAEVPHAEDIEDIGPVMVERARRLAARAFMGFGSDGHNTEVRTGFRSCSNRSGTTPAHDWANFPPIIAAAAKRLRGVVIECRPAIDVMRQHDGPQTLHYVDPPYMPETRSQKSRRSKLGYHAYRHEMTVEDHGRLLNALCDLHGMVVLSAYQAPLYAARLGKRWRMLEIRALADGARERTEILWLNAAAQKALR